MIIRGRFVGDAPYFAVHLRSSHFQGIVWFLADTGASRTTLLDRDVALLGIPAKALEAASLPVVGIGGSVRSFLLRNVELTFTSNEGDVALQQDIWSVQHDLQTLHPQEASRILRLPSLLGRDVINRFHLSCHYKTRTVHLER